jgi:endonuclease/exonuclease/phosphatase family metal-dependent hydrolase
MAVWLPIAINVPGSRSPMLTVMTYNVGAGLAAPQRLVEVLRESGADIIGLQELAPEQGAAIADLLDSDYPHQVLHAIGIPGKGLISRFPVHESELLELHPGRPDLQAVIAAPGGELTVIVAHPPPPRIGRNRIRQAALADQQISGIAVVATRGQPAVLLTDFNRVGWQAAYRRLRQSGLIDAFNTAGRGTGFTLPTRLSHLAYRGHPLGELPLPPLLRVDYVWHTPHFRAIASWIGGNAGSDHLPVLAELVRVDG